jgi:hypothetical protein
MGIYTKLEFKKGQAIVFVSASVENTYVLFGFKETPNTLQRKSDIVNLWAIESTNIKPKFDIYPAGIRTYKLLEWEDIGLDLSSLKLNESL